MSLPFRLSNSARRERSLTVSPSENNSTRVNSPELASSSSEEGFSQPSYGVGYSRAQLWMHRVLVLLFVFLCAVVGVLLVILPWHPEWTDNRLLLAYPSLRSVVSNNFFRGICSGLGVLDIWIGFWEAVHYHEGPRSLNR